MRARYATSIKTRSTKSAKDPTLITFQKISMLLKNKWRKESKSMMHARGMKSVEDSFDRTYLAV